MNNNSNASNSNRSGDEGGGRNGRPQTLLFMVIAALIMMMVMSYMTKVFSGKNSEREITYDQFVHLLDHHYISAVTMQEDKLSVKPKKNEKDPDLLQNKEKGTLTESQKKLLDLKEQINKGELKGLVTGVAEDETTLTGRCLKEGIQVQRKVPDSSSAILNFFAVYVLPILLMWGLLTLLFRRMGKNSPFSVGRSNAKVYVQKETGVTFKDVAGEDEAKESLVEVVDFLHNPGKYGKIGAKLPKGALLVGPPGTGKTLLAKAVAGEAHVPFFSLAGSDFIELYVGVGASRVRDLFKEATKNAPCIIFIDEIDAIGRSRDSKYGGGNEEREQTLNQLLSEMDGFDSSKGVLILGATNRPEILDKALLRPGRFDRRIIVDKPDLKGREEILRVHARDVKMDQTVDLKAIALATSGAVGSDLANMINEAAINAVKAKREYVCQKDLMDAVEQVLVGKEKKDRILSKEERKIVSYHEIGHALIAAVQKNTEPVQKITIVPRTMGALGYVMQVPEDEKFLKTQVELRDEIVVTLGGRAAEELIFNTVTTGAENDIEKATAIARNMVTLYGMSKRFGLMQLESIRNRYLDGVRDLTCSDETATGIDEEVRKILDECYAEAKGIISKHLDTMDRLAQYLIENETITGAEFMRIFREVEHLSQPQEDRETASRNFAVREESRQVGENIPVKGEAENAQAAPEKNAEQAADRGLGEAPEKEPLQKDLKETPEEGTNEPLQKDLKETPEEGTNEPLQKDLKETPEEGTKEPLKQDLQETPETEGGRFSRRKDLFE